MHVCRFLPVTVIPLICTVLPVTYSHLFAQSQTQAPEASLEFNRDIRPILSDNCFYCHGPDKSHREADLRLDDREAALSAKVIQPGQPEESEIIARIFSTDTDEVMPPPHAHKKLTDAQKKLLSLWVEQGAKYQKHWAYEPPVKPIVPTGQNGIDFLVRQRLQKLGIKPSKQADKRTLARRAYFDLIGLPPTPARLAKFLNDPDPKAYEKLVDQLLRNAHFGERMAISWLDLVRFADTIGYHSDNPRNIWPYRDWVINSFNDNKPFDRFTIEQLAGDLLPDSDQETKVGSAFNRLLLTTEEGGAQPKDYRSRMLTDRVRAVGTVWLGQTTGCAQCHDHKFDPFSTKNFYQLGAFFADIAEADIGRREPGMPVPTLNQKRRLDELDVLIKQARAALDQLAPAIAQAQTEWETHIITSPQALAALKPGPKATAVAKKNANELIEILRKNPKNRTEAESKKLSEYFQANVLKSFEKERTAVADLKKQREALEAEIARCLVSSKREQPLEVRIQPRGDWLNESGEIVKPAFPEYLPQPDLKGKTPDRLDLAQWLVSREHPLTARAFVNRLMAQYFGKGLSKVLDDLGTQGELPVNQELLDWLACEFMDSGWDVKHMVRTIVTSETYKQVSTASETLRERDPDNRELARQTPLRLESELIRDNALFIAGLLELNVGGPSIKPYQPEGYWENLNFPVRSYEPDSGPSQYRRGLYVWWQRTFLHPSMLAFDAPSREECTAERSRSNLPQQALVLLNDPTYVEAARTFAARVITELPGSDLAQRLSWTFELALQRKPSEPELKVLLELISQQIDYYKLNPDDAEAVFTTGLSRLPEGRDKAEVAAWSHVARVLLNLHETITRE